MSDITTTVTDQASAGADELKALVKQAEKALRKTKGRSTDEIEALRERLKGVIADSQTMIENITDTIRRQASRADDVIRANPYQAIGIATGIGLLAGFLLTRKCQASR